MVPLPTVSFICPAKPQAVTPNQALQLTSAYPARARCLSGLHPQGSFELQSRAVTRMTAAVALAAERQGR